MGPRPEVQAAFPRRMIRRSFQAGLVLTGVVALTSLAGIGQELWSQTEADEELDRDTPFAERLKEAAEDSLTGEVVGGILSATNPPNNEAEACLRQSHDLQLVSHYEGQDGFAQQTIAELETAATTAEIQEPLGNFLKANDIDLVYNSVESPASMSLLRGWLTQVDSDVLSHNRFDDRSSGAVDVFRAHAIGVVTGLGLFPEGFNKKLVDYVIFTGDRDPYALASAHDGFRSIDGLVVEMPIVSPIEPSGTTSVHEVTHTAQYKILEENKLYFRKWGVPIYGTWVPDGFRYAEHRGVEENTIVDEHPEYFTLGPARVFTNIYGSKNELENGATTVADMLFGGGIITPDQPDWASLHRRSQTSWLICYEVMMPGFIDFAVQRDMQRKNLPPEMASLYIAYTSQEPHEIYESLLQG